MKRTSILLTIVIAVAILFAFSSLCPAEFWYKTYPVQAPLDCNGKTGLISFLYDTGRFYVSNHKLYIMDGNYPSINDYVSRDDGNYPTYADSNFADDRDANYIKHETGAVTSTDINDGTVASADVAASLIQIVSVDINIAEVKTLFSAPKTLLAAPGTHNYYEFLGATVIYESNSAAYETIGNNMTVKYTNGSGAAASGTLTGTGFLDQTTTDKIAKIIPVAVATTTATSIENQILVLCMATADPCGAGDGVLHAKISYRTIASGL